MPPAYALLAIVCALAPAGTGAVAPVAAAGPVAASADGTGSAIGTGDQVLRKAGYEFRYFGRDLGDESFVITRTADGYRIDASLALSVDGQVPSEATYVLDAERRLVRATYRELIEDGAHAEYVIADGVLTARGLGGSAQGEVRIPLEPGAVVTGPHYVTDFFVLQPLALEVNARREQVAYAFGFSGWKPARMTLKSRREKDRTARDFHGNRSTTTVYRCEIVTADDTYRTKSHLDADGVSVFISIGAPIGSMSVLLD